MKTKLFFLLIPLVLMSCGPKPADSLSEKDMGIIKSEIKEVVDVIIKGCEEPNFDMAVGPFLDSPDFVYIMNGNILSYQDVVDGMKPVFDLLSNQEVTIVSEKISFIDKSTVLYTTDCKFLMNYEEGNSVLLDPCAWFLLFRKIDNNWKVIYGVESYVEKPVENNNPTSEIK